MTIEDETHILLTVKRDCGILEIWTKRLKISKL